MADAGMKCVGLGRSSGTYEGRAYDNVLIHCLYTHDKVTGQAAKQIKVKNSVFLSNPVKVGETFDINCDTYGAVKQIVKF